MLFNNVCYYFWKCWTLECSWSIYFSWEIITNLSWNWRWFQYNLLIFNLIFIWIIQILINLNYLSNNIFYLSISLFIFIFFNISSNVLNILHKYVHSLW